MMAKRKGKYISSGRAQNATVFATAITARARA